jgi:hypothetical protein
VIVQLDQQGLLFLVFQVEMFSAILRLAAGSAFYCCKACSICAATAVCIVEAGDAVFLLCMIGAVSYKLYTAVCIDVLSILLLLSHAHLVP